MSKEKSSIKIEIEVKKGEKVTGKDFILKFPKPEDILGMKVNGLAHNLHENLNIGKKILLEPIYANTPEGENIVRRSLVFVMAMAMEEMKTASWTVEHQLSDGYFCCFKEGKAEDKFLGDLKKKMNEIFERKIDIVLEKMYYDDAIKYFRDTKCELTISLLESIPSYEVYVDSCGEFKSYHHRVLLPDTKLLQRFKFDISKFGESGWILRFLFFQFKDSYQPAESSDKEIIEIHDCRTKFNKQISIESVGDINRLILQKDVEKFVSLSNCYHDSVMNSLVRRIQKEMTQRDLRLILIAGPSSSGKTTFARNLKNNLQCRGIKSQTLTVDNYFCLRELCPKDEEGNYDFETLKAMRIDKLNSDLKELLEGKEVMTPVFDFKIGKPDDVNGIKMKVEKDTVIIMEGIHCLNDELTKDVPNEKKYKVFIAPLTPINLDDRNYISNKVIRLIRRSVRDSVHRGYSVEYTLRQWNSVMKGEHLYIFPYLKSAHFVFNTALDYEINVLKPFVEPLLKSVKPSSPQFDLAQELLGFLSCFLEIPCFLVPRDSLLQEFIAGHESNLTGPLKIQH